MGAIAKGLSLQGRQGTDYTLLKMQEQARQDELNRKAKEQEADQKRLDKIMGDIVGNSAHAAHEQSNYEREMASSIDKINTEFDKGGPYLKIAQQESRRLDGLNVQYERSSKEFSDYDALDETKYWKNKKALKGFTTADNLGKNDVMGTYHDPLMGVSVENDADLPDSTYTSWRPVQKWNTSEYINKYIKADAYVDTETEIDSKADPATGKFNVTYSKELRPEFIDAHLNEMGKNPIYIQDAAIRHRNKQRKTNPDYEFGEEFGTLEEAYDFAVTEKKDEDRKFMDGLAKKRQATIAKTRPPSASGGGGTLNKKWNINPWNNVSEQYPLSENSTGYVVSPTGTSNPDRGITLTAGTKVIQGGELVDINPKLIGTSPESSIRGFTYDNILQKGFYAYQTSATMGGREKKGETYTILIPDGSKSRAEFANFLNETSDTIKAKNDEHSGGTSGNSTVGAPLNRQGPGPGSPPNALGAGAGLPPTPFIPQSTIPKEDKKYKVQGMTGYATYETLKKAYGEAATDSLINAGTIEIIQ